jgi:hypothetical protein
MRFEESILISASAEKVFALYSNVAGWSSWDPDVKESSIDGAFVSGVAGTLRPSNGPKAKITLTEVIPNRLFTVESKLPLSSCVLNMSFQSLLVKPKLCTESALTEFSPLCLAASLAVKSKRGCLTLFRG